MVENGQGEVRTRPGEGTADGERVGGLQVFLCNFKYKRPTEWCFS